MNIANGPNRPLPAVKNPPLDYCIRINLPNDREWIGAFYDALYQLTYWFAWARDDAHTGREIALTWLKVLDSIRPCLPEPSKDGCCDGELTNMLRQNPDNECQLQSSSDGTTWCTVFDVSKCTTPNMQPGDGSPQPPAGGCTTYHAAFLANTQWLLPTVVNAGDVLNFSNPTGAATDGSGSGVWYCPAGDIFFAGKCTGIYGTSGADPRPASAHMGTIVQIAGVWYDTQNPVTVPGGVTNAQATFQVNDSNIADNSGGYSFDVEVCNNGAATFEHVFDFALSPEGFSILVPAGQDSGNCGHWVAGSGFEFGDSHQTTPEWYRRIAIARTSIPPFAFLSMELTGDLTKGAFAGPGEYGVQGDVAVSGAFTAPISLPNPATVDGNGQVWSGAVSVAGVDELLVAITASSSTPGNTVSGNARITKLKVRGLAPDPF